MAGRPLKFKTPEELEEKINEYFATTGWQMREVYDKKKQEVVNVSYFEPATITGLAVYLDTSRETLREYKERPEFVDAIKKAKDKCEYSLEYGALTNNLNPAMAIFSAKNNYEWRDKTEVENEHKGEMTFTWKSKSITSQEDGQTSSTMPPLAG